MHTEDSLLGVIVGSQDGCHEGEACARVVGPGAAHAECHPGASSANPGEVEPLWSLIQGSTDGHDNYCKPLAEVTTQKY